VDTCDYNGTTYALDDTFDAVDGCNTCTCTAGGVSCTEIGCDPKLTMRYFIWDLPTDGELIAESGVRPYIRVRLTSPTDDLPEDYVKDPTLAPAEQLAASFAAWVKTYQGLEPFRSNTPLEYSIYPQNIGSENWSDAPYFHHPDDHLGDPSNPDGLGNPFSHHGRVAVSQYTDELIPAIESALAADNLPRPTRLHFDMESGSSSGGAMKTDEQGNPVGWWSMAQADPRFISEGVVEDATLSSLHQNATLINGAAPAPDYTVGTWEAVNGPFHGWIASLNTMAKDFVLRDTFFGPAKELWPNTRTSNYGVFCTTPQHHIPRSKIFIRPVDVPSIGLDFQSPVFYPPSSTKFGEVGTRLADHLAYFGLPPTETATADTMSALYRARAMAFIDAVIAACPDKPVAPWIGYPGWIRGIPGVRLRPSPKHPDICYSTRSEDIVAIMKYGAERGINEWLLWTGDPSSVATCDNLETEIPPTLSKQEVWTEWAIIVREVNEHVAGHEQ